MRNASDALEHYSDVPIKVTAEVGRLTLTVREIVSLEEGSILRTSKPAGESVDLYFGGIPAATADVTTVNGALLLQISGFVPPACMRKTARS